jgi:hypothetical protein
LKYWRTHDTGTDDWSGQPLRAGDGGRDAGLRHQEKEAQKEKEEEVSEEINQLKLCKDCKHAVNSQDALDHVGQYAIYALWMCGREQKAKINLVTGLPLEMCSQSCTTERYGPFEPSWMEFCGPQATFFEPTS